MGRRPVPEGRGAPFRRLRRRRHADPGGEQGESAELRKLRRRNKLLEQENEILRRATAYFARDVLPK